VKAMMIKQGGDASVLTLSDWPKPEISAGQVLVQVKAIGVNPIDCKLRAAPERFPVQLPLVIGCDAAGIISAVGAGVVDFKVGDEVYFSQPGLAGWQGTYAEYVSVDALLLAHKPRAISFVQAAAAPLVLITAWEALHDRARLQAGQRVLIHAGAGGVGHVAVQLAKLAGASVATTVSSREKAEWLTSLGADKTILYREQNVCDEVMAWSPGGVDVVLDTVGGQVLQDSMAYVRLCGDVVTILQPVPDFNWGEARLRNVRFSFELMLSAVMLNLPELKRHHAQILQRCAGLMDEGKLHVQVAKTFPLTAAADAQRYLERQHPSGKVVLMVE